MCAPSLLRSLQSKATLYRCSMNPFVSGIISTFSPKTHVCTAATVFLISSEVTLLKWFAVILYKRSRSVYRSLFIRYSIYVIYCTPFCSLLTPILSIRTNKSCIFLMSFSDITFSPYY